MAEKHLTNETLRVSCVSNFLSATDKSRSKNTLTQKRTVFTLRNFFGKDTPTTG